MLSPLLAAETQNKIRIFAWSVSFGLTTGYLLGRFALPLLTPETAQNIAQLASFYGMPGAAIASTFIASEKQSRKTTPRDKKIRRRWIAALTLGLSTLATSATYNNHLPAPPIPGASAISTPTDTPTTSPVR